MNNSGADNTKEFPISFSVATNSVPLIILSTRTDSAALLNAIVTIPYKDKFTWKAWKNGSAASTASSVGVYWLALGY